MATVIREWLLKIMGYKKEESDPWYQCRWIRAQYACTIPLNEGENMPTNCDSNCPVRVQIEQVTEKIRQENERIYN